MGAKKMGSQVGGVQRHTLMREGSLYSLTLAEVENQLGNLEKPFGSMNLDELLKTVWTTEASKCMGLGKQPSQLASSSLVHCQPNLVMSRELSNKTVDEVLELIQQGHTKNNQMGKDQVTQLTLGEMTLEDFLAKAGIVTGPMRDGHDDLFGDEEECEFSQQSHWMQCQLSPVEETQICHQQLGSSISGFMASDRCLQQPILTGTSRIMDVAYAETQLAVSSSPTRGMISDTHTLGRKRVAPGEVVEKTVERRQKRMIKNRESAARSRARRQAYTNELENKIAYLEEEIERLKKQLVAEKEVICEPPPEPKHLQLRRTLSGPL